MQIAYNLPLLEVMLVVPAARESSSPVSGRIGVGPMRMQPGDSICIPFQSETPSSCVRTLKTGGINFRAMLIVLG
jgi:hypothetical protein